MQEDVRVEEDDVYDKLEGALTEAEKSRREAYEESRRRQRAEREAIEAARKAKAMRNLYGKEMKHRKEVEEALLRDRCEADDLRYQIDKSVDQLHQAMERKSALEARVSESHCLISDLEKMLSEARNLLERLRGEREEAIREREEAVREADEIRGRRREGGASISAANGGYFSEFSYAELAEATRGFDRSCKIGEGGYGCVYKGFLHHTMVAIKILNPESTQGLPEFFQELDVLSRVRHPNLVTLVGACPEASALVYEFLSNGSLEDRLDCKNGAPALLWQARIRIAAEICAALIFLHSCRPTAVVHGDLKTANILLDASLMSKIGDFGISRLLTQSSTFTTKLYHDTCPKGTFAYMDPEFVATGTMTPSSDVYSFGVVLLRLLTGKPALGLVGKVRSALGDLREILDPRAGDWPITQAKKLTHLALSCCQMRRESRVNLRDSWKVLENMIQVASPPPLTASIRSSEDVDTSSRSFAPSYFVCPISKELMKDPHVAADGFTYEGEAIRAWLVGGHNTSPRTNLKLGHGELLPNLALRSAIQDWQRQQQFSF